VCAPDGKLRPRCPPSAPLLAPPEALAGEQPRTPAWSRPASCPLAEQALTPTVVPVWSNFLTAGDPRRPLKQLGGLSRAGRFQSQRRAFPGAARALLSRFRAQRHGKIRAASGVGSLEQGPTCWAWSAGKLPVRSSHSADFRKGLLCGWRSAGETRRPLGPRRIAGPAHNDQHCARRLGGPADPSAHRGRCWWN